MPAQPEHVALSEFRVTLDDGDLAEFTRGKPYDGPPEFVERLLAGNARTGPLIAKRTSDEGKAALADASDSSDTTSDGSAGQPAAEKRES